jgi:xylulokinase
VRFLGIDLGTSGVRVLLTDAAGAPLASAERPCTVAHPHPGWSEQDPMQWIDALNGAVAELRRTRPDFAQVAGIAVAGHMHGATALDAAGRPLRPCILWNDTRSHAEAAALDATEGVRATSGNIVFPGFTAPKLEWMRTHEPEIHARIAHVLLPAAFLTHYLTGETVADMSDSAGTAWFDVRARDWSEALLAAGHMRCDQMPRLVEGCAPAGRLRPTLAAGWGLPGTVIVAGGAGDNAAAACGIGALNEGQGFVSLGTSGVLLVARKACTPAPESALHTFCHAVPERWYQMGVMLSATDSLNWLARIGGQTPTALTTSLGPVLAAPGRARFYPYLSGERTPHNDAFIRGAFTGLDSATDLVALTQAVLEGVAFGLRDSAEAMRATGTTPDRLFAIGGGAASGYWLSLIATVLGVTLLRPRGAEFGAALGAARLARIAVTGEAPEQVMTPPDTCDTFAPVAGLRPAYDDRYHGFRAAYAGLRAIQ